jgi:hypothetical protein
VWDPDFSSGGGPGLVDRCDLSMVGRAAIVLLPCMGSVPFLVRKASRQTCGRRLPRLSETGVVTHGHSAEHGDERAGGHRMCLSDLCVVLVAKSALGLRVRSATWGTGSDSKFREEISDGGAPNETFGS